jgi:elongation factor Ts
MKECLAWLRKNGVKTAAKKSDRAAADGLVGIKVSACGKTGVAVEVNSETDFVARNPAFQTVTLSLVEQAAAMPSTTTPTVAGVADIDAAAFDDASRDALVDIVASMGENCQFRRAATVSVANGVVAGYVHNKVADPIDGLVDANTTLGRIGCLVGLDVASPPDAAQRDALAEIAHRVAMHVVAADSVCIDRSGVNAGGWCFFGLVVTFICVLFCVAP